MKSIVLLVVAGIFSLTIGCGDKKREKDPDKTDKTRPTTLQIVSTSDSSVDCKISIKEIEKYNDEMDHKVCGQLEGFESTLQSIYKLASNGDIFFNFSGSTEEEFNKLIDAWKSFLEKKSELADEPQVSTDQVEPYSFQVISQTGTSFTVSLKNKNTDENIEIEVQINVSIN